MANDRWVLTAFSRYCPDCLSDTTHVPGGPVWQGSWRLPHTFLCERHNRLLVWQCPACRAPAFSNGYRSDGRWRPTQLIPAPGQRLRPALYLNIPLGSLRSSTVTIRAWQKEGGNAEAYQSALRLVADRVIATAQGSRSGVPAR